MATPWTFNIDIPVYSLTPLTSTPPTPDWIITTGAEHTFIASSDTPNGWAMEPIALSAQNTPTRVAITAPDTPGSALYTLELKAFDDVVLHSDVWGRGSFTAYDTPPVAEISATDNDQLLDVADPYIVDGEDVLFDSAASTAGSKAIRSPSAGPVVDQYERAWSIVATAWNFEKKAVDGYIDSGSSFAPSVIRNDDGDEYRVTLAIINSYGIAAEVVARYVIQSATELFGSILDAAGVLFSAVNDGDNVQVSRFPNGIASRELLAVIPNAKNPSYAYDKRKNRHFVSYEDRNDGEQKMVYGLNAGREFVS